MTSVYEIVSACRMCGVGAGYKLPIIQSIFVGLEVGEIELKQKIKECLQIEVTVHDRMPPLICELCADTIHDFYEFRKMCHETNKRTRLKLGLPLESTAEPKTISSRPAALNSDSDESEPLSRHQSRRPGPKSAKMKKQLDNTPKMEAPIVIQDSRSPSPVERKETRPRGPPSPKRLTRNSRTDDLLLTHLQDTEVPKPSPRSRPGPLSRKERGRQHDMENSNSEDESDNSLLVPSLKRPREVCLETSIKRTRLSADPTKQDRITKAGPKSSKDPKPPQKPPPKPDPKSKKRETSPLTKPQKPDPSLPAPKSRRSDNDANKSKKPDPVSKSKSETPKSKSETPKSKSESSKSKSHTSKSDSKARLEAKPELVKLKSDFSSASKSRRVEEPSGPASKTKRTESSAPGPRSRKLRDLTPKPPEKVPERPPSPTVQCNICGAKLKTTNGLSSHLRIHVPNVIQPRLACNACELWFATVDESTAHHRTHTVDGVPYTCNKCYDDFRSTADYDMHFVRAQCIATYEAPDVKCEECWRLFPTYRLLEGHRCGGEGARPGGKCVNCHRSYATQKSLATHEMRCTPRKKAEPETEEVSSRDLLPMRVRIVRCDSLLQRCRDGCDVSGLTRKFGLDPNSVYPYLSMTPVKVENNTTFHHMVSIRDEIKMEYLKDYDDKDQSVVHWDSDDENDDAKSVDSLSNMSLKTLFSPKCLGKVPKKKIDLETGNKSNSSLGFHEDFSLNKIIGDHVKESNKDYDSDSILDKVIDDKKGNSDTETLAVENSKNSKEIDKLNGSNETECDNDNLCKKNDDSDKVCTISSNNEINTGDENTSDSCDLIQANEKLKDENLNQTDESKETESSYSEDFTTANYNQNTTNNVHQSNEHHKTSPKNGHPVRNNKNESLEEKDEVEGNLSESENTDVDHKLDSYKEDVNKSVDSDVEMNETQLVQIQLSNKDEVETNIETNFSETYDTEENNVKTVSNSIVSDSETNVGDLNTNKDINKPPLVIKDDVNENIDTSQIMDDTLNHSQSKSQNDDNGVEFPLPDADNATATTEPNLVDSKDSLITENELFENAATPSVDKFNINFLDEEERLLMAELDAQIGENPDSNITQNNLNNETSVANENIISDNAVLGENSAVISENRNISENGNYFENNSVSTENFIEKNVTLDAILNKQNDLKSLDLDSISSEDYNFDI